MSRKTDKPEPHLNLFVILVLFAFFVLCIHYAGISPWTPTPAAKFEPARRWSTGPSAEEVSRKMNGRQTDIEKPE